jgi:hypothetical protein
LGSEVAHGARFGKRRSSVCVLPTRMSPRWLGIADDLVYKGLTHFLGRTLAIVDGNEGWGLMQLSDGSV